MSAGSAVHNFDQFRTVAAPARIQSTEDPYERVLSRLEGVKASGKGHKARCPAHDDRQPSLSVSRGSDGRVLLKCHTGCSFEAVVEKMGLTPPDLFPPSPNGTPLQVMVGGAPAKDTASSSRGVIETTYDYEDDGELVYQTVRKKDPKGFYQRRPDGNGGWVNDLRGVKRVLYQRPALMASDPAEPVFLPEGEKDVDNLRTLGLVATTAAMGAGSWIANYNQDFAGRDVVILVDNDKPGREHAEKVATQLVPVARSVKVLALPGLPEGGDVSDWLADGGTVDRLRRLADLAPAFLSAATPVVAAERNLPWSTAREIAVKTPDTIEFVAWPLAVIGSVSEVDSAPKRGKTTLLLDMVASVLAGRDWLGYPTEKGPVVYLSEQGARPLRAALDRAGLLDAEDLHVLSWPEVGGIPWPDVMAGAVAKARAVGAKLVVVDTLGQWAGLKGDAENDAGAALEAVRPVQEAAANHNLAIVILRHERKAGGEVGESARGSSAFGGAVDSIFQLRRTEGGSMVNPRLRVLNILSRYELPDQVVIELTDDGYIQHGNGAHLAFNQAITDITAKAPFGMEDAKTEAELLEAAKVKRTIGQKAIEALVSNRTLIRTGAGKRGSPYRYHRLSGEDSDAQWAAEDPSFLSAAPIRIAVAAERNEEVQSDQSGRVEQTGLELPRSVSAATHIPLGAAERNDVWDGSFRLTPDGPHVGVNALASQLAQFAEPAEPAEPFHSRTGKADGNQSGAYAYREGEKGSASTAGSAESDDILFGDTA